MESTYGGNTDVLPPLMEAEMKLLTLIKKTLENKGKVVIPSFAVGRAQEIMVILAEQAKRGNFNAPVYLDGMIWDATAIHTTYPEFLSRNLQGQIFHQNSNPFTSEIFKKVENMNDRKRVIDGEPSVIITTSGMLTGGPIMEYLKQLGEDKKNTLIFVGYQAEGTLGSRIQKGWRDIPLSSTNDDKREVLKMNMNVETVGGFSGHSDKNQLINYVYRLRSKPERIILNHGEASKIINLSRTLHKMFNVETVTPNNLDVIRLK
jgi:predicted metal-dependent RNase